MSRNSKQLKPLTRTTDTQIASMRADPGENTLAALAAAPPTFLAWEQKLLRELASCFVRARDYSTRGLSHFQAQQEVLSHLAYLLVQAAAECGVEDALRDQQPLLELTGRQREMLALIRAGLKAPQIATQLGVEVSTVYSTLSDAGERLNASGAWATADRAYRLGLIR